MTRALPLVEPHRREHTYCAFCPKLCRHSCPVSTVQARETTTPWGKMTSLHHVAAGSLPLSPPFAATWYACTGCLRCRSFCAHGNEVAAALGAGRAEAVRAGVAPAAARDVIARHAGREERAARAAQALFPDRPLRGRTVHVPGCTAITLAPDAARAGLAATDRLAGEPAAVHAARCCGLPLLEAGDRDGFVAAARAFLDRIAGAADVVFHDPGCLFALRAVAPSLGLEHALPLRHIVELAAAALDRLGRVPIDGPVRYLDACRLGRGLGVYEEPRAVLGRILGRAPAELYHARAFAECSGAGGQLPRTDRPTADAIARERADDHHEAGGGTLVTACPASAHHLSRNGAPVRDLATLIAAALR